MQSSNSEILNACSNGTLYLLTEYSYQTYQKVVTLSTETYYQPVSQTIYVSKVCNNGLTGSFTVELVKMVVFIKQVQYHVGKRKLFLEVVYQLEHI